MSSSAPAIDNDSSSVSSSGSALPFHSLVPWIPVLGALLVNLKVLSGGFLYDDFVHLFAVTDLPLLQAISHSGTQHLLQSYKFVVWIANALFGANPLVFFALALVLHLVNVRLLFEIVVRLTHKQALAGLCAGFWGMSPLAVGSLFWISVHGQIYATAALLWLLLDAVRLGESQLRVSAGLMTRHAILLLIAATSYGTGLVAVVVYPLVILLWGLRSAQLKRLLVLYTAVVAGILLLYLTAAEGQGQTGKAIEKLFQGDFSRLLAQLNAFASLWSVGFSGLLLGPFMIGKFSLVQGEWLLPITRCIGLFLALPLLFAGLSLGATPIRLRIMALLLLASAVYGLIALARSGGMLPFQPEALRYHYLAAMVIAIIFGLVLSVLLQRLPEARYTWAGPVILVALLAAVFPFHLASQPVVDNFHTAGQYKRYSSAMSTLEQALAEGAGQSAIYIPNEPFKVFIWQYTPEHFPGLAGLFVISYPENTVNGARVYFVEESEEIVDLYKQRKGTRIAELLVPARDRP